MDAGMLQRRAAFADAIERTHELQCDARAERIAGGERPPPFGRSLEIARCLGPDRKLFERGDIRAAQPLALGVSPPVELVAIGQEKAIQKRSVVHADRGRWIVAGARLLESGYVRRETIRVEAQIVADGHDDIS